MPKFKVDLSAFALVTQCHEVEAEDKQQALEKVMSDEYDTYHGNQEWKYRGIKDNSIVIEATEL